MTPQEYRDALEELGLSIVGAAPVLGIDRRTAQRWAALDGPGPTDTAAILLRMFQIYGVQNPPPVE